MKPEEIRLRTFETVRKGFNPAEVQRFQEAVADDFLELLKRTAELERRCAELVEKERGAAQFEEQKKAAEEWRDKVLADLARKRAGLKVEIARLRAGRDVLKQALEEAVGVLEAPITRLDAALRDARLQGDSKAARAREERLPTAEEMRAELEAAALADFVSNPSEAASSSPASSSSASSADLPPGADELEETSNSQELDEIFARARAERAS